ncbi:MAG: transcription antitermination factor NusB [Chlamydiae bacterium]|jgi:N utilization substance protein B|nr:transcription antitermination factor NusB [Chlamydiota bacterium]
MEFLPRAKFRELVFLILYGLDHHDQEIDNLIDSLYDQVKVSKRHLKDAAGVVNELLQVKPQIDELISSVSTEYAIDRICKVELNLIRLAIYEMMKQEIPPACVISEAVRLARKFSTNESSKYVNAILDQYAKGQLVS